ncbi:MAG TPA: hypothetical protein VKB79_23970 [Bryobacteraceae bacterium]|nr:hypothetical protein [Bryobacteraceae bacterium]
MFRAIYSSLLSFLLVATLLGGGCISCEQYFMLGKPHGCCDRDGRCKTKAPTRNTQGRNCNQIAFDHQKTIDLHVDLRAAVFARINPPAPRVVAFSVRDKGTRIEPSPPNLQILHSVFLI